MSRILLMVVSVFLLFPSACGSQPKEELLSKGVKQLEAGNPNGATVLFKNALDEDPNFFEARFQLAKAYMASGKSESAERELKKVLTQNPSFRDARVEMTKVYLRQAKVDEAREEVSRLLEEEEEDSEVDLLAGQVYATEGDHVEAEKYFTRAIASDTENVQARIMMAENSRLAGKTAEARSRLEEILEKDPSHVKTLHLLGSLQLQEGEDDEALLTYERILEEEPEDLKALYSKGIILIARGDSSGALTLAEKMVKTFPRRPEGNQLKSLALMSENRYQEAIITLQKVVAVMPTPITFHYLGSSHFQVGELEQALTQFHKALDLDPSFLPPREMAAMVLLRQGRIDDSVEEVKRAIAIEEDSALAHNILGSAYIAKGMVEEGVEEFNRALEIDPDLAQVHMKKGLVELKLGRGEEGLAELRTAVKVAPDLLNSRVLLASYHVRRKEFDTAMEILREGIKGRKQDAVLHTLVAGILLQRGGINEASLELKKAKTADPESTAAYYKLAQLSFLKGEREEGVAELQGVLEQSPGDLKALLGLAGVMESDGKNTEAREFYRQAAAENTDGAIALAGYHVRRQEPEMALEAIEGPMRKTAGSDVRLYELKGRLLLSLGREEKAIETFEEMEEFFPGKGLPYVVKTYLRNQDTKKALKRLQVAMKKNPERIELKADLSRLYWMMGQQEKALENAVSIKEEHPDSPAGYFVVSELLQKDGKYKEAVAVLQEAESLDNVIIFMALGGLMASNKDYEGALVALRKAEMRKPGYVPAIFQQGTVYHASGARDKAIEKYRKVLSLSSNHKAALNNLAYMYAEDGNELGMALQLAAKAYMANPQDGLVLDTLGFVLLKSGKSAEAVKALEKAVEKAQDSPMVHYHLALAYKEDGQTAHAVASLEEAIRLGKFPEEEKARRLLAELKAKE